MTLDHALELLSAFIWLLTFRKLFGLRKRDYHYGERRGGMIGFDPTSRDTRRGMRAARHIRKG